MHKLIYMVFTFTLSIFLFYQLRKTISSLKEVWILSTLTLKFGYDFIGHILLHEIVKKNHNILYLKF